MAVASHPALHQVAIRRWRRRIPAIILLSPAVIIIGVLTICCATANRHLFCDMLYAGFRPDSEQVSCTPKALFQFYGVAIIVQWPLFFVFPIIRHRVLAGGLAVAEANWAIWSGLAGFCLAYLIAYMIPVGTALLGYDRAGVAGAVPTCAPLGGLALGRVGFFASIRLRAALSDFLNL